MISISTIHSYEQLRSNQVLPSEDDNAELWHVLVELLGFESSIFAI